MSENITCKNCFNLIPFNSKFCPLCGVQIQSDNSKDQNDKDFIISTGSYNGNYNVLGIAHHYHLSIMNKQKFGEKNLSFDNQVDNIIDLLIDETEKAGGDGLIFLRVEFFTMQLQGEQIFVYGTMIKRN